MQKALETWVQRVHADLGDDLVGIILYGSAVREEMIANQSDLNLMVVFKKINLTMLTQIGAMTRKLPAKLAPRLICWTQEELENAWDVFPLEFDDISQNHRCLLGEDPFSENKVDRKTIRYQLEFELRSKILALRSAWLGLQKDKRELEQFLIKAGTSFNYLLGKADKAFAIKAEGSEEMFEKIKQLKKRQVRFKIEELHALYDQLHRTIESIIKKMNAA